VAPALEDVTISDIERELARLREEIAPPGEHSSLRTSSMTHIAWVPEAWERAAFETLAGLAERHPSRGIVLLPRPEEARDALDAEVDLRCFRTEGLQREICAEVIAIRLNGSRAKAPASVVMPLLIPDLPVFLRWRGELPLHAPHTDGAVGAGQARPELVDIVDRLIVDSREWADPAQGFAQLTELFERVAVSDIAWARTEPWREAIAALWPQVAEAGVLRVTGPESEALLLVRWLRTRLRREVRLEHAPADELEHVEVDGRQVRPGWLERPSSSELLSAQLDLFGRDRTYEQAVAGP
jgi:glucose-6-phosphate dehydrogenase-like protein OpcA